MQLVPFSAGSSAASAPAAAAFAAPAAGAASGAPASSLAEERGKTAAMRRPPPERPADWPRPSITPSPWPPANRPSKRTGSTEVSDSEGLLCAYPPQSSGEAEYALRAVFSAEEAGSALDGYAGEDRCDDSGQTYAAYELSRAEFDGVIDALDAADLGVTEDGGGEDAPCLIAVYP
ncbi:MAG: hypothetical protein V8R40_01425 [Dysosmobacter sp.]